MASTGGSDIPTPPAGKGPPDWLYCTKHKTYHPRDQFYDNPRGKYGKSSWCKQSMSSRNKRLRYQQKNYTSPETLARRAVQNALKKGTIVRPLHCTDKGVQGIDCTGARLEFHHTGTTAIKNPYDPRNWLVGVFVCHQHHNIREGKAANAPTVEDLEEEDANDDPTVSVSDRRDQLAEEDEGGSTMRSAGDGEDSPSDPGSEGA